MHASSLLASFFPVLLIAAALFDLTSFRIPNILSGAIISLFPIFLIALALSGHTVSWGEISGHVLAGAIGLVLGMALFAAGWVGGGDAKLFAAICLWLGWESLLEYVVLASLTGGLLTFALLWLRNFTLPSFCARLPWLLRLADPKSAVPYGLALVAGALLILPGTELFRLAIAS
jgi:prepilin peptidase CpaA